MVARVSRLRIADDTPLAIERASLSSAVLPDPEAVGASLYAALEKTGNRPVRAMQRISAANLGEADAQLLDVPAGSASLNIERISYLATGKVIEFTRSIYRGDTYDFVAELRLERTSGAKDDSQMTEATHMRREIAEIPEATARLLDAVGQRARRGRRGSSRASIRASSPRWRAARPTMRPPS